MEELHAGTDWNSLIVFIAYGLLICLYLVTLKLLLNCIEQLMSSKNNPVRRSIIDVDIHREAANRHADDKTHMFDPYAFALTFLKIFILITGVAGIFIIITIKLNVFFAFGIAVLVGVIAWQLVQWHNRKGKEVVRRYENIFIKIGGYNIGTLIFFVIALVLITAGLILLP